MSVDVEASVKTSGRYNSYVVQLNLKRQTVCRQYNFEIVLALQGE